ncbi:MAG: class I SAM-dependent methyltransferase [Acidimicrobiia bacterium]
MSKPEAFWDRSAANYDKTEERFEHIHHTSREAAKRHLKSSDKVLDYGCGTGTTACELAGCVDEILGIDISGRMIELSKEKAAAAGVGNVTFERGDIFDSEYDDGSFDVVLAFNMLHTVPDPGQVVRRVHDLLQPDGLFISVTPCLRDKMSLLVQLQIQLVCVLGRIGIIPVPIRRLRTADLSDLITSQPFSAVETTEIYAGATSYLAVVRKQDVPTAGTDLEA